MAIDAQKQELWSATISELLKKSLRAAAIANTNVVNTSTGDKMHIVGMSDVAVASTPAVGSALTYAEATDSDTEFTYNVDQYFAINAPDKDIRQTTINWQQIYAQRGAYKLAEAVDAAVFSDHASWTTDSYETGTTEWTLGTAGAQVPELFASINAQMNDLNMASEGRYIVLPTNGIQAIELYLGSKGTQLGDVVSTNGYKGKLHGLNVYHSNNLTSATSVTHGLAGVAGDGIAYGQQINPSDIEMLRDKDEFSNFIRGRVLAGYKVYEGARCIDVNLADALLV